MSQRRVGIIGAGITGLVAADALSRAGLAVTVYDSADRPGGQIRTVPFAGHVIDVGAEALHLGDPGLADLLDRLDLGERVVRAAPGTTWIWTRRGLRRLPAGVGPAGPTRLWPVITSGTLGPVGLARAALEPAMPARLPGGTDGDVSVGKYLSHRFGQRLVDALVDPVLGTLHAGDVSRLSLRAATPYLAAQADRHRSLLAARRHGPGGPPPTFATFPEGLATLVDALIGGLVERGADLRLGCPVTSVRPDGDAVTLAGPAGEETVDGAVLAVPAHVAATVLGSSTSAAARSLSRLRSASVVTVLAAYPRGAVARCDAFRGNGVLVASDVGRFLKAATFLGSKWPHLRGADTFLVRLSAGRIDGEDPTRVDDDELVSRLHADLADATGLASAPCSTYVQRWPRTMAQLEVGHRERVAGASRGLSARGPVVLAGAPYEGVGVAACVRSGAAAAGRVLDVAARAGAA